ncbi:ATP-binding protein [Pseudonocardiaceae bacterium YIM PH 21723]|nr:ATP-binding protein [Pseudonocardiaceae bacterium YIM PH 21723]
MVSVLMAVPGQPGCKEHLRTIEQDLAELAPVRQWAVDALNAQDSVFEQDVLLVVDELVSNALRHATGPYWLSLCSCSGRLRVTVSDNSAVPARTRAPDSGGGRGMRIVTAYADDWGQTIGESAKMVWAEFRDMSRHQCCPSTAT